MPKRDNVEDLEAGRERVIATRIKRALARAEDFGPKLKAPATGACIPWQMESYRVATWMVGASGQPQVIETRVVDFHDSPRDDSRGWARWVRQWTHPTLSLPDRERLAMLIPKRRNHDPETQADPAAGPTQAKPPAARGEAQPPSENNAEAEPAPSANSDT